MKILLIILALSVIFFSGGCEKEHDIKTYRFEGTDFCISVEQLKTNVSKLYFHNLPDSLGNDWIVVKEPFELSIYINPEAPDRILVIDYNDVIRYKSVEKFRLTDTICPEEIRKGDFTEWDAYSEWINTRNANGPKPAHYSEYPDWLAIRNWEKKVVEENCSTGIRIYSHRLFPGFKYSEIIGDYIGNAEIVRK